MPQILKKTKSKVRKIAKEIDYLSHRSAVRLRTGKPNVVAVVLSSDHTIVSLSARLISSGAEALRG